MASTFSDFSGWFSDAVAGWTNVIDTLGCVGGCEDLPRGKALLELRCGTLVRQSPCRACPNPKQTLASRAKKDAAVARVGNAQVARGAGGPMMVGAALDPDGWSISRGAEGVAR